MDIVVQSAQVIVFVPQYYPMLQIFYIYTPLSWYMNNTLWLLLLLTE